MRWREGVEGWDVKSPAKIRDWKLCALADQALLTKLTCVLAGKNNSELIKLPNTTSTTLKSLEDMQTAGFEPIYLITTNQNSLKPLRS